ncbi:FAD/NAD(P)-binding oxidoreductase [Proteobacteria bacterium 005FR1]|nr:FAD/NAD(P)-binding oxidoreductase [Proteobacteria bacterium 005FR1]
MNRERLIVVGNGMIGQKFLEQLVALDLHRHYRLTVLSGEPHRAYDRVHLSDYFRGRSAEDLALADEDFFHCHDIDLRLAEPAETLRLDEKTVITARGNTLAFDKLVLATGSFPFVPPVPGHDRSGCMVYRTIEDLEAIKQAGRDAEIGVVIGGGLLGLEAASALRDIGLQTHVVEFAQRLMAVQVDDAGGRVLRRKIEQLGVFVHTEMNTKEIVDGDFYRHRLNFADGKSLETDLVVFSAGIRPQDTLARHAGLTIGERGGVVIDNFCRSSHPDVYCIGEAALWQGRIFGLVAPGYEMARVAASHLASLHQRSGQDLPEFTGADMSTKLKLLGVDVASVGDAHAATPGACCYRYEDESKQLYKKLVVSEDKRRLLGAVLVGEAREYSTLLQVMLNEIDLPESPEALILPHLDAAASAIDPGCLPEPATICACQAVSKGDLQAAIAAGHCSLGALKTETGAATGCGGCASMVEKLLAVSERPVEDCKQEILEQAVEEMPLYVEDRA